MPIRKIAYSGGPVDSEVKLWKWKDVRLMTHKPVGEFHPRGEFRVSEETTGYGIPNSFADTEADAEKLAIAVLEKNADRIDEAMKLVPTINFDPS